MVQMRDGETLNCGLQKQSERDSGERSEAELNENLLEIEGKDKMTNLGKTRARG